MRELPSMAELTVCAGQRCIGTCGEKRSENSLDQFPQVDVGFLHLMHDSMVRTGDE